MDRWNFFKSCILIVISVTSIIGFSGLVVSTPVSAETISLTGTIRDFLDSHPDFENGISGLVTGIVQSNLGGDGKPVYSGCNCGATHGAAAFDQWYRDVDGVNLSQPLTIVLDNTITADPNVYTFADNAFFPIDGQLFGNQGRSHNYHFTYEIHSQFTYQGGEFFQFTGDDDLWVFINNQLAVDLGGVHGPVSGGVDLDTLGLTVGETYNFDLFFAERHTVQSNFRIDTSIILLSTVMIDIRKEAEGADTRTFPSDSDVDFEIVVTNTGNVDLTDVEVTDDQVADCANIIGDMIPGAMVTHECTVPNVTASFENVACVTGQANGAQVEDCDPSNVEIIDIDIRKEAEGPDNRTFLSGSDVTFEIVVTNTGDEDLFNVEVTDSQVPGCAQIIGDLAAGASVSYSCTSPDVMMSFVNEACVTGERNGVPVEDCDPSTVVVQEVAIDIRKEAEGADTRTFPSGSDVDFEIVVTNTGNVDLTDVEVTDDQVADCANIIGDMIPGAMVTYECTVPNVTASFENVACVTGQANDVQVEDCDPSIVEIIDIDIRKQAEGPDSRIFPPESDVLFEIVVTNTGDEDLENVIVADILVPECDRNIGFLAFGESLTYICTSPDVMMSFVNEACVTGERNGVPVEDCDPSTVEIEGGGEGCTPGYWKQTQHFDSWTTPLTPDTLFSDVFEDAFPGKTLLDVLKQGGGGLKALGRHTVAAFLNAASSEVSYDLTINEVIEGFNDVFPYGDYEGLKDLFESFNEQGCPLN